MNRTQQAKQNAKDMPNVKPIVDLWRKHFPNLKVLGAEDFVTGKKAGDLK